MSGSSSGGRVPTEALLTESQILRFARHVLVRELGGTGQQRLLSLSVRLPRLDQAGREAALWLARSGVGRLVLPNDRTPAPCSDSSGLLWSEDAGHPLIDAVLRRLLFHGPDTVAIVGEAEGIDDGLAAPGEGRLLQSTPQKGAIVDLNPVDGVASVLEFIAEVAGVRDAR